MEVNGLDEGSYESRIQSYWKEVNAYDRSTVDSDECLYFLDGPPNPSGKTHLGTIWNKVLKDAVLRHARMSGYSVIDRPGFDTHLFTTEQRLAAEQDLTSIDDLRSEGIEAFEQECETFESSHINQLIADFQKFGVWMDWENAYRTDEAEYADAAWWVFKRMYDAGNVEQNEQVTWRCAECDRTLHKWSEVKQENLEYRSPLDQEMKEAFVTFPLVQENAAVVTRVATPWKILFNTFLTVDPDQEYVRIDMSEFGSLYVSAETYEDVLVEELIGKDDIVDRVSGEHLVGMEYAHPLQDQFPGPGTETEDTGGRIDSSERTRSDRDRSARSGADYYRLIGSEHRVEVTGIGHGAPACAESDRRIAIDRGMAIFDPLSDDGTLGVAAGSYENERVTYADEGLNERLVSDLSDRGALLRRGKRIRPTKQCWFCGNEVLPTIDAQWYVTLRELDDQLREAIQSTDWIPDDLKDRMLSPSSWHPDWSRDGRFDADQDANQDWLVEQEAYWGLPIPVWISREDPDDVIVIGSRRELAERADGNLDPKAIDPRRSELDDVTITENGRTYERIDSVFADRFTASLAAVAVAGVPSNDDRFDELWPADLIIEAKDQPGLWFFMQLATGVATFGEMPFERAYMHGFLTDENGDKMSKSVGNVVTPDDALDRCSADAMRLYLLTNTEPDTDLSLDWQRIDEITAVIEQLLNTCQRIERLRDAVSESTDPTTAETVLNTCIQNRLERTADRTASSAAALSFDNAAAEVLQFSERIVSDWYIELLSEIVEEQGFLSRRSYDQFLTVLLTTATLLAPYAPHLAEAIYQSADGNRETVHAEQWPFDHAPASEWMGSE